MTNNGHGPSSGLHEKDPVGLGGIGQLRRYHHGCLDRSSQSSCLSDPDSVGADRFVRQAYFWTQIRKNRPKYAACRGIREEDVTSIIRDVVIVAKDATRAEGHLLDLPGLRNFSDRLKTDREREDFRRHLRKYINIYLPDCPFEVATTNRYTVVSHEAAVMARKFIKKGEKIKYLSGIQVRLTPEEELELDRKRGDFSIVMSSRRKQASMFLGPARFANHDCEANARLVTTGCHGMEVAAVRDIQVDQEITVTYGADYFGLGNRECLCKTCEDSLRNGWASQERSDVPDDAATVDRQDDGPYSFRRKRRYRSERSSATPALLSDRSRSGSSAKKLRLSDDLRRRTAAVESLATSMPPAAFTQESPRDRVSAKGDSHRSRWGDRSSTHPDLVRMASTVEEQPATDPSSRSRAREPNTTSSPVVERAATESAKPGPEIWLPAGPDRPGEHPYVEKLTLDHTMDVDQPDVVTPDRCMLSTKMDTITYQGVTSRSSPYSVDTEDSKPSAAVTEATSVTEGMNVAVASSVKCSTEEDTVVYEAPTDQESSDRNVTHLTEFVSAKDHEGSDISSQASTSELTQISDTELERLGMTIEHHARQTSTPAQPPQRRQRRPRRRKNQMPLPAEPDRYLHTPKVRIRGDYVLTRSLLSEPYSAWVTCTVCESSFVQNDAYFTRAACARCERHSKLYGYRWPKTDKEGKSDADERILDHRTVHRFIRPQEEKTVRRGKYRGMVRRKSVLPQTSNGDDDDYDNEDDDDGGEAVEDEERDWDESDDDDGDVDNNDEGELVVKCRGRFKPLRGKGRGRRLQGRAIERGRRGRGRPRGRPRASTRGKGVVDRWEARE